MFVLCVFGLSACKQRVCKWKRQTDHYKNLTIPLKIHEPWQFPSSTPIYSSLSLIRILVYTLCTSRGVHMCTHPHTYWKRAKIQYKPADMCFHREIINTSSLKLENQIMYIFIKKEGVRVCCSPIFRLLLNLSGLYDLLKRISVSLAYKYFSVFTR